MVISSGGIEPGPSPITPKLVDADVKPERIACLPVIKAARDGVHSGVATRCCVKIVPLAASRSRWGVFIVVLPLKPTSP